ncbi:MAG: ATP-binding cassette domain-containing protein [Bacteroidetes bacterium]|nr:ATP-binding cassette domain-containing protein [Bacteroidota bacterium]
MDTLLSLHEISKNYGKIHAVDKLSMNIHKGQVFGILGPNGSGKTTTLSIVLDLIKADHGSFQWFGNVPSKETRKRIGSVIESPNFFPYLSAQKNLEIVAEIKDLSYDDIPTVLKMTGLYDRMNSKFRTFSFGMKQRLAVASALLGDPDVLILDEPTNGLDPQGIAQIREIILRVAGEGITIILASHLLDEVQKICSHVAVLNKGKILFDGEVSEVLAEADCIEVSADNLELLGKVMSEYPQCKSIAKSNDKLLLYFKTLVKPQEINQFLFSKGITVSHLMERKRSLEKHFLELLAQES